MLPTLLGRSRSSSSIRYKPGQSCRDRQNWLPADVTRLAPVSLLVTTTGALPATPAGSESLRSQVHNWGPAGPRFQPDPLRRPKSLPNNSQSHSPLAGMANREAPPCHFGPFVHDVSARPNYQRTDGETASSLMSQYFSRRAGFCAERPEGSAQNLGS